MNQETISAEINRTIAAGFAFSAPILVATTVVGLVISIVLAATQIQEQTIGQVLKLFLVAAMILLFGVGLSTPLMRQSEHLFNDFPAMTR